MCVCVCVLNKVLILYACPHTAPVRNPQKRACDSSPPVLTPSQRRRRRLLPAALAVVLHTHTEPTPINFSRRYNIIRLYRIVLLLLTNIIYILSIIKKKKTIFIWIYFCTIILLFFRFRAGILYVWLWISDLFML